MTAWLAFTIGVGISYIVMKWWYERPVVVYYDKEEVVEGCTVQILENTETGECSFGWWRGGKDDMPSV